MLCLSASSNAFVIILFAVCVFVGSLDLLMMFSISLVKFSQFALLKFVKVWVF